MTALWLAYRYFGSWRKFFNLSIFLSVLGIVIGVASLVVSMAVFSGYNKTLEGTVQDAMGHILILKRGASDQGQMLKDIEPMVSGLVAKTPFIYTEAILAHGGKINGVLLEGIDEATVHQVLNLKGRLVDGSIDLARKDPESEPNVLIGKGIAQKFDLKVGDVFRIVVPLSSEYQAANFKPKLGRFRVKGVINFGRYDFDSRYVVMAIKDLQTFAELGDRITGYRLKIDKPHAAREIANQIAEKFGSGYWARDWLEMNRNLFEAAQLEKIVLFFVLQILILAAAFNTANTLFISVVQKYRDISVLKTMGASDRLIRQIFITQGLIVGAVGATGGIVVGLLLCQVFEWAQSHWQLIPAEVYRLDHINLQVDPKDMLAILGVTMLVCFIATIVPSRRGARISPVDGLRYE